MKRKVLAALCVTAVSASLLAGCGSNEKAEDTTKTEDVAEDKDTADQESGSTEDTDTSSDNVATEEEAKEAGSLTVRTVQRIQMRRLQRMRKRILPVFSLTHPGN